MSIYQIAGGIFFILTGLVVFGVSFPGLTLIIGVAAIVAGIALIFGK